MSSALQGKNAPATSAREAHTARVVQSASGPAHPLLALQSAIGNQAVVRLLREPPRTPWEAMARSQIDRVHVGSGARIHTDDAAAMAADGLKARAVTVGGDVYFGRGQFAPGTPAGDRLLRCDVPTILSGVPCVEHVLPECPLFPSAPSFSTVRPRSRRRDGPQEKP